jgi:hypothetical protein
MRSIESQIVLMKEVCRSNGKEAEANAIMSESAGQFLEKKLAALDTLAKPFVSTDGKKMLIESFKANFNMTEAQARVAAGVDRSHKNDGQGWDILTEVKK